MNDKISYDYKIDAIGICISFLTVLFVLFKFCGAVDWDWIWIFSPI